MKTLSDFQKKSVITSLKRMFAGKHFSICTVKESMSLTGCHANPDDLKALSLLHCVNFDEMDEELRQMVFMKTMQIFQNTGYDLEVIDAVFDEKKATPLALN